MNDDVARSAPTARPKRKRRLLRRAAVLIGVLVLVLCIGGIKGLEIRTLLAAGKQMAKNGPPPEVVGTAEAVEQTWEQTLLSVGTVEASRGVTVSNEVAGIVSAIHFESGATVQKGQVLVELDTNVERAQLESAVAKQGLAKISLGRSRDLMQSGSIPKQQLDTDESAANVANADVATLRAQLARKTVCAPFSGRLGIRAVNVGQYLSPGTRVTVLETLDPIFVDFTLPQETLGQVSAHMPVRVSLKDQTGPAIEGAITAIDPAIDSTTRTISVRASVANASELLRPGMFVKVSVVLPTPQKVVAIPQTALVHAVYGDSVFIVEDGKDAGGNVTRGPGGQPNKVARQQFVRTGESRGDFAAIQEGVGAGQVVVTAGAFKLQNGARVAVNNQAVPAPQLAPHPENR